MKRDHETLERVFQRLATTAKTSTTKELDILSRYLQQWHTSLEQLMSQVDQAAPEEG